MAFGWNENNNLVSSQSLAGGNSTTADIDLATNNWDRVFLTVEAAFGGSPDGDVKVEIFPSSNSGTDDDSVTYFVMILERAAGSTVRESIEIPHLPYVAVKITNENSNSVTVASWYAGRTIS